MYMYELCGNVVSNKTSDVFKIYEKKVHAVFYEYDHLEEYKDKL